MSCLNPFEVDLLLQVLLPLFVSDSSLSNFPCSAERDYTQGAYAESFIAHLALHASSAAPTEQKASITEQAKAPNAEEASPVASTALERLKLAMVFQGSNVLDAEQVLEKFKGEMLLSYEKSILLGKVSSAAASIRQRTRVTVLDSI